MGGKTELRWRAFVLLASLAAVAGREEGEGPVPESKESRLVTTSAGVRWGLVDAAAIPGKLFEYSLPRTTHEGQPAKYTVFEAGSGDRLPKWLSFDSRRNLLEGVPSSGDRGRSYAIEISAENIFGRKQAPLSSDVIVIDVRKEVAAGTTSATPLADLRGNGDATLVCAPGDPVTMATVTMDADLDAMRGSTRAKLIRDFGRSVGVSVTSLRMTRSSFGGHEEEEEEEEDRIPLVAGPGNVVSPKDRNGSGLLIRWVVGCGSVGGGNVRILERLEASAVNGTLAADTGSGIIGWHVTSSRTPRRRKRLVPQPYHGTPTPLPTQRPPFGRPTATRMVFPNPESRAFPPFVFPGASSVTSQRPQRSRSKQRHPGKTRHVKQAGMASSRGEQINPGGVLPVLQTRVPQVTDYPEVLDTPKSPEYLEPSLAFPVVSVTTVPTRPLTSTAKMLTKMKLSSSPSHGGRRLDIPGEGGALPTAYVDNNFPPIWRLSASVGEVFTYAIPNGTFHGHEDVVLVHVTPDDPSRSWVKVDSDARTLYGLPLEGDAGRGRRYALVARDSKGEIVERYDMEILISRRVGSRHVNHEVKVDLDAVYDHFMVDVDQRIDVATRIAHAHGDRSAADVTVARILAGSVRFFWSNRSLADADPCPVDALRRIADRMIRVDGLLDPDFARAMEPHVVRSVEFTPKGACATRMQVRTGHRKENAEQEEEQEEEEEEEEEYKPDPEITKSVDGLLLTTIVPILILIVVAILVLIIVCVVCARKNKKKNKNKTEEEEERERLGWETASRKGVPVIFADELDELPATAPSRPLAVPSSSSSDERRPMVVAFPAYDHPTQSPSSPPLVPGRDLEAPRNSPPAYNNNGASRSTSTSTGTGTPHHRRAASSGTRARQVPGDDPPQYVSS